MCKLKEQMEESKKAKSQSENQNGALFQNWPKVNITPETVQDIEDKPRFNPSYVGKKPYTTEEWEEKSKKVINKKLP